MASKIAGVVHVKFQGRAYTAKGDDIEITIQAEKKEEIVDSFGNGYIKSMPMLSVINGSLLTTSDLNPTSIADMNDVTVQCELQNGKVALLRNAFFSGDAKVNPSDGTFDFEFRGQGRWI